MHNVGGELEFGDGEDSAVEGEDGEFDGEDGGAVEEFVGEEALFSVGQILGCFLRAMFAIARTERFTLKYCGMFSRGTAAMCLPDPRRVISIERVKHPRVNMRAARLM